MGSQVVTMSAADRETFLQQINEIAAAAVAKGIGPALDERLKPLTEKQLSYMEEMLATAKRNEDRQKPAKEKGLLFARVCRAYGMAALATKQAATAESALFYAKQAWGADDAVVKSLQASIAAQAGNLVRPDWSSEIIELLRNETVIDRIPGIRTIPMPVGSMTFRRQSGAATASYVGESVNVSPTQQSVELLTATYKKLMAVTPVSNDLLRFAGPEADAFVRDDLVLVYRIRKDLACLRGDGTQQTPMGILNLTASGNKFNQTGTVLANVQADLAKLIRLVQEANVPLTEENGAWVFAPRTRWGIYNMTATTGNYVFRSEMDQGRLLGFRFFATNQIPTNLNGTQSEIHFICGPQWALLDSLNMQVEAFYGGAYWDGAAIQSGISRDETVIRIVGEHDFQPRHAVGAAIHQQTTWA